MYTKDLRAELSIKMLELEKALDHGMPYSELKFIYNSIKELQFQLAMAEASLENTTKSQSADVVS